ncbi:GA module-containing protein [Mycoplasma simbae]|uniref:GA module-containing protein n=1 Tax=Mycoplasma simbae TaxID=36744 RepID=UPI0004974CAF|nr:GA module-containing protein [Mycoplasma simbae]
MIANFDLIAQEHKDMLAKDIENVTLPEKAIEIFANVEYINNIKHAFKNDIDANIFLNDSEKTELLENVKMSTDMESFTKVEKKFTDLATAKSDAYNKIYFLEGLTRIKKMEYAKKIFKEGVSVLNELAIPYNNLRKDAIKRIMAIDDPFLYYKESSVRKIIEAESSDEFDAIVSQATTRAQKVYKLIKDLQSHPSITPMKIDLILERIRIMFLSDDEYVIEGRISAHEKMEKSVDLLISKLKNLCPSDANRDDIVNYTYTKFHVASDAYVNFNDLINKITEVENSIKEASNGIKEEEKQLLLSELAKFNTLDDIEKVNFKLKTIKEKYDAKKRVDSSSELTVDKKQEIKTAIDNASNFYEVFAAEKNATPERYQTELARSKVQSDIYNLEFLSFEFKNKINNNLYSENSSEAMQAKYNELAQLNQAKKHAWEQMHVELLNFNNHFWAIKLFEFKNARTEEDFNNVIRDLVEQNSKVNEFITKLDTLSYLPQQYKQIYKTQAINSNSVINIGKIFDEAKQLNFLFSNWFSEIERINHITEEKKQEFLYRMTKASSYFELNRIYE